MRRVIALECPTPAITQDERAFFVALSKRGTPLRKNIHTTQVQLDKTSTLWARTLGVSVGELISEDASKARKRGASAQASAAHGAHQRAAQAAPAR